MDHILVFIAIPLRLETQHLGLKERLGDRSTLTRAPKDRRMGATFGRALNPASFVFQPFPSQYGYADVQEAYGRSGTPAPLLLDDAGPRTPDDLAAAEAASGSARVRPDDVTAEEWAATVPKLAGFCPVTLVRRNGLPLRGVSLENQSLGPLKRMVCYMSALSAQALVLLSQVVTKKNRYSVFLSFRTARADAHTALRCSFSHLEALRNCACWSSKRPSGEVGSSHGQST